MGILTGTSTLISASSSVIQVQASDLGYIVVLLICIFAVLLVDLTRRVFIRK